MEIFYFGKQDSLCGLYHPARGDHAHGGAVVLCGPIGQEHIRSHRAVLQLARRLSRGGFHCLRFDYFGCGDSHGEFVDGGVERWLEDVAAAVEELRAGTATRHLCLIGLRLGATLAALAGARVGLPESMVLWDPVVVGDAYLDQLVRQHQSWLEGSFAKSAPGADDQVEILGFPMSGSLVEEIKALDLTRIAVKPARRILVIRTSSETNGHRREDPAEATAVDDLTQRCRGLGGETDFQHLRAAPAWIKVRDDPEGEFGSRLVPANVLDAIVTWLKKAVA